jgi:hypothetical protein
VRARVFFAPAANGLDLPWCNFPYGSHIAAWVEKLLAEYERGPVSEAVALVPARTDARWFGRLDPLSAVLRSRAAALQRRGDNAVPERGCLSRLQR